MATTNIQDLNDECLQAIFALLFPWVLKECRLVCRRFSSLIDFKVQDLNLCGKDLVHNINYQKWPSLRKLKLDLTDYCKPDFSGNRTSCLAALHSLFQVDIDIQELHFTAAEQRRVFQLNMVAFPDLAWTKLRVLDLHGNGVHLSAECLRNLAKRTWMQLEVIRVGKFNTNYTEACKDFARFLSCCPVLKTLDCSQKFNSPNDLAELMSVELPLLETFVARADIYHSEAQILVRKAASWPSLKTLKVGRHWGSINLIQLANADFPHLECLDIQGRCIDGDIESVLALRTAIETRWKAFKRLIITDCDEEAIVAFLEGDCPMLEEIEAAPHEDESLVSAAFVSAAQNGRLKHLTSLAARYWPGVNIKDLLLSGPWLRLKRLVIEEPEDHSVTNIVSQSLAEALERGYLPALNSLSLDFPLLPIDIQTIFRQPWSNIHELTISDELEDTDIDEFVRIVPRALPKLKILSIGRMYFPEHDWCIALLLNAPWPALEEIRGRSNAAITHEYVYSNILIHAQKPWDFYIDGYCLVFCRQVSK